MSEETGTLIFFSVLALGFLTFIGFAIKHEYWPTAAEVQYHQKEIICSNRCRPNKFLVRDNQCWCGNEYKKVSS